jgi:hypothetical protein
MQTLLDLFEHWKPYVLVVYYGFTSFVTFVLWPLLYGKYRMHKQYLKMVQCTLDEVCEVVMFGVFDGVVQFDPLGSFPTTHFRERLARLITNWNVRPSPDIICTEDAAEMTHLRAVVGMNAASCLTHSSCARCYLRVAKVHGNGEYRCARLIACLVRPDPGVLSLPDCPRIVVIEEGALEKIMRGQAQPNPDKDGLVWLGLLRQIGEAYQKNLSCIATFTTPVDV